MLELLVRKKILHAKVALSPLPGDGAPESVRDGRGGRGSKEVGQLTHPAYAVHTSSADSSTDQLLDGVGCVWVQSEPSFASRRHGIAIRE